MKFTLFFLSRRASTSTLFFPLLVILSDEAKFVLTIMQSLSLSLYKYVIFSLYNWNRCVCSFSLSFNIIFYPRSQAATHDAIVAEMCFLIYQITHTERQQRLQLNIFFHRKSHSFLSYSLPRFCAFFSFSLFVGKHQLPKIKT